MVSVKWVLDSNGEKVEAIVPRKLFEELIELRTSLDIYSNPQTQRAIKKAEQDLKKGRYKIFASAQEAIKWLKKR